MTTISQRPYVADRREWDRKSTGAYGLGLRRPLLSLLSDDDGQLNLPKGGHAELPGGGQRDYFV